MKKLSILLSFIATLNCLSLSNLSFASTAKNEWLLEQSFHELGEHKIYVASDAVKIVCPKQGFTVIARAPDWDANCYRQDNKKLWVGKLKFFAGDLLFNPFANPIRGVEPLTPAKDVKYAGVICSSYTSDREGSVAYGSKTIAVSPMACELLCRYFNLPRMHEVPLYRRVAPLASKRINKNVRKSPAWLDDDSLRDHREKDRVVLSTTSLKKIAYKASDFELPQDYKLTKEAGDIGVTGTQRSQIGAVLDELGFSTDYARNEQNEK